MQKTTGSTLLLPIVTPFSSLLNPKKRQFTQDLHLECFQQKMTMIIIQMIKTLNQRKKHLGQKNKLPKRYQQLSKC